MMRVLAAGYAVMAATALGCTANAQSLGTPTVLKGACSDKSHIAEGLQTEDLTKRQSRFFCSAAVITHPNGDPNRVLIMFAEAQSNTGPQIGFAGTMPDRDMVQVKRVYLQPEKALQADDGACKFFRNNGRITGVFCGAKIDNGTRRTVPVVSFEVAEAQMKAEPLASASATLPPYRESGVATCTCPGTNVEFFLDGEGGARLTSVRSNYVGFTNAARVKRWTASLTDKDGQKLLILDNGQKSRIMTDPSSGKGMGFLADGGVSDMLCQVLVKPK